VLTCGVAAAAGAVIGRQLAGVLLKAVTGQHVPAGPLAQAAVAAAAVFVFCLIIIIWPALRPAGTAVVRIGRGRPAAVAGMLSAGADIALIILAVLAVRELHAYSVAQATAGSGVDPVIAAAPALALAGLAVIPLRLLPLSARVLDRLTARGRRLGAAMANWEISRRPVRQSGPVLLVILAVGIGTVALSQYQSWQQSVHDQAAFAAGADVRVDLAQAASLATAGQVSHQPGVRAAMAVSETSYSNPADVVLALGSRQAAATVLMRRDLAAVPAARLWREISPPLADGIALPGRPARLAITAGLAPAAGAAGAGLWPVSALLTLQDASGAAYVVSAGTMPADGKLHQLIGQLAPAGGAAYPLRLLGVSLTDTWPQFSAPELRRPAVLTITRVTESALASGPVAQQVAPGALLAGWHPQVSAADLQYVDEVDGAVRNPSVVSPQILNSSQAGGSLRLTLRPGNGPDLPPGQIRMLDLENLSSQVTLIASYPQRPLPAIATRSFLSANGLHVGSVLTVPISQANVRFRIVSSIAQFPTLNATGALIADQAAVQDVVASQDELPLPVTQWWLATTTPSAPGGTAAPTRGRAGERGSRAPGECAAAALRHRDGVTTPGQRARRRPYVRARPHGGSCGAPCFVRDRARTADCAGRPVRLG
jgi:hypothetical protein